jgi:hypothetical protein
MMDKVHKHNLFNTNTPSSESYKNEPELLLVFEIECYYKDSIRINIFIPSL